MKADLKRDLLLHTWYKPPHHHHTHSTAHTLSAHSYGDEGHLCLSLVTSCRSWEDKEDMQSTHTQTHTQSVLGSQRGEIDILTLVSWMAGFMYDIALYNRHCNTVIEQFINYHFKLTAINLFWGFQQCCSALIHQHPPLFFSSLTSPSVFMGCFMVPLVSPLVEVPPLYTIFAWVITTLT